MGFSFCFAPPGGAGSELAPEGPIQHRREERVQLLRRADLVFIEPVNLGLEIIEAGDDAALFVERAKVIHSKKVIAAIQEIVSQIEQVNLALSGWSLK